MLGLFAWVEIFLPFHPYIISSNVVDSLFFAKLNFYLVEHAYECCSRGDSLEGLGEVGAGWCMYRNEDTGRFLERVPYLVAISIT